MAVSGINHHFWRVDVGENGIRCNFTGISISRKILDSVTRTVLSDSSIEWVGNIKSLEDK